MVQSQLHNLLANWSREPSVSHKHTAPDQAATSTLLHFNFPYWQSWSMLIGTPNLVLVALPTPTAVGKHALALLWARNWLACALTTASSSSQVAKSSDPSYRPCRQLAIPPLPHPTAPDSHVNQQIISTIAPLPLLLPPSKLSWLCEKCLGFSPHYLAKMSEQERRLPHATSWNGNWHLFAGASPPCAQLFAHLQPISCPATQAGKNGITFYELFCLFMQGVTLGFSKKELLPFVLSVISSA